MSVNLGKFTQFYLGDPDDCMDLIEKLGFTNAQIKDMKSRGIMYHSVNNKLLEETK